MPNSIKKLYLLTPDEGVRALGNDYRRFIQLKALQCQECYDRVYAPTYSVLPIPLDVGDLINICDKCASKNGN